MLSCSQAVLRFTSFLAGRKLLSFCVLRGLPQRVSGLPSMTPWWRTHPQCRRQRVWSLVQEDPLEEETATHSRILAWRFPRTKGLGGPQPIRVALSGCDWCWAHSSTLNSTLHCQFFLILSILVSAFDLVVLACIANQWGRGVFIVYFDILF